MQKFPGFFKMANTLISFLLAVACSHAQSQRPNIIYIMTDDMGYGDLSCYGNKAYSTPNLDKLASQGMKFVNAYSAAPVCTPTRVAFMTGRYPAKTPIGLMEPLTNIKRDSTFGLTPEFPSIGTLMKARGYETALIGKWHLGFLPQHRPEKNGFDYFFGILSGAADYISHGDAGHHDLYENNTLVYPEGYMTDLLSQKAVAYIKQKHDKPFFLNLNFTAPHWPWQAPGDKPYADSINWRDGGSPATYAAMMKSLDDAIGAIMKNIDGDRELYLSTIVIFTNDNGGERYSDNGGLSKSKMSLWEGGIRVPAFVRWPEKIKAGSVTQQVAVTMDWTATILAAGSAKAHPDFPLDGINLMPVLTGNKKQIERTLYWRTSQRVQQKAIRMGEWKYLQDAKGEYLFNVLTDQTEKKDLKELHPDIFGQLKKKYTLWEKTLLQPVPL
ncbi:MAG: twin-arginine translocation pathway signal protein [Marivirga sp.]|nr:twin-arginine translocation pathway signal protein [Marivirga sp.]